MTTQPRSDCAVEYTRRNIRAAWAVHALTASGVIVGYLGLISLIEGHARAGIIWLIVALILDGVDGPIARKLDVAGRIPTLNGNSLDLIVDYFTCAIVPVALRTYQDDRSSGRERYGASPWT